MSETAPDDQARNDQAPNPPSQQMEPAEGSRETVEEAQREQEAAEQE